MQCSEGYRSSLEATFYHSPIYMCVYFCVYMCRFEDYLYLWEPHKCTYGTVFCWIATVLQIIDNFLTTFTSRFYAMATWTAGIWQKKNFHLYTLKLNTHKAATLLLFFFVSLSLEAVLTRWIFLGVMLALKRICFSRPYQFYNISLVLGNEGKFPPEEWDDT